MGSVSERNGSGTDRPAAAAEEEEEEKGGAPPFQMPEIRFTKLYINGCFVDAVSGRTFENRDPRTGDVIATVAEGDKEDVDLAVKAARDAFDHGEWPRMSGSERWRIMTRFADLVEQHADELAALEGLDAGKHPAVTKAVDIGNAAGSLRYFAGAADKIHGETLKMQGQLQGYTLREPLGVAGLIIPWNFPTTMFGIKVAPALAAGCTMVVKPAEQTPLSALYLADLAKQAGIPDGVINVVPGFGPTAGAAIASHMNVDMVSFTGSTEVGRLIMEASARSNLKPVSLELGGKSPLIIFDDADLDMAVEVAVSANFFNKGEACVAASRVYVQEGIYDRFEKKLAERMKSWVVGDPLNDPRVNQGPQVDKAQYERVLSYIEHGKREGATLLTGGKPCGQKGYYIEPTVFTNVKEDMIIAKEEIFGPVMSLMKFKTVEEAIARANDTQYGLGAGVVTRDLDVPVILMLIHQFITFGFACTPLYFVWEKVIGMHDTKSIFKRALARLPIVVPIWFLAIIFPFFGPINSAVGALLVSFTVYIIPSLAHILTYRTASARMNAAEKPPFFLPSWTGMFVVNVFIVVWVLVVGFGLGGWASMVNFIRQIDTFGLFAKCYQCPKPPVPAAAMSPAPLPHH